MIRSDKESLSCASPFFLRCMCGVDAVSLMVAKSNRFGAPFDYLVQAVRQAVLRVRLCRAAGDAGVSTRQGGHRKAVSSSRHSCLRACSARHSLVYDLTSLEPVRRCTVNLFSACDSYAVSVCDHLLVVHNTDSRITMIFDIWLQQWTSHPVAAPLPLGVCTPTLGWRGALLLLLLLLLLACVLQAPWSRQKPSFRQWLVVCARRARPHGCILLKTRRHPRRMDTTTT